MDPRQHPAQRLAMGAGELGRNCMAIQLPKQAMVYTKAMRRNGHKLTTRLVDRNVPTSPAQVSARAMGRVISRQPDQSLLGWLWMD